MLTYYTSGIGLAYRYSLESEAFNYLDPYSYDLLVDDEQDVMIFRTN